VGIRWADHATPSTRESWHCFADSGGRSVGIVRLRTKATEFSLVYESLYSKLWDFQLILKNFCITFNTKLKSL
jgi:hypothetical protein